MSIISINPQDNRPLVEQIVAGFMRLIDTQSLRKGSRLPSIRQFALEHQVSRFTVVQAYDRLVAAAYITSRKGSGFFVCKNNNEITQHSAVTDDLEQSVDVLWILRRYLNDDKRRYQPGSGWLPADWLDDGMVRRAMRQVSRGSGSTLVQYGKGQGFLPLRQILQQRLADQGIHLHTDQIITTHGVSHALDLIARYYIKRGDIVLVDDPAYFNLFGCFQTLGAKIIAVPRIKDGPDIHALEKILHRHSIKLFVTSSLLQNPTGTNISPAVAFQLLNLAQQHDFMLVDDDIYGDFHSQRQDRLGTLDQLNRVIQISSFSKTISGSLRVGYIACHQEIANNLLNLKLLTHFCCSELNERIVYEILSEGLYRKHLNRLQRQLDAARENTLQQFDHLGIEVLDAPTQGYFLWGRLPDNGVQPRNAAALASLSLKQDMLTAPGNIFSLQPSISAWMRFNIAYLQQKGALPLLEQLLVK